MFRIEEGCKIKLITGEIARIAEILEDKVAYVAEILKKEGGVSIEQIAYSDIESVFEEIERPLREAM